MADLDDYARLVSRDHGLAVVATLRAGQEGIQASVVNTGVLAHPARRHLVVGFTTRGNARKLAHLRARPVLAVTVRDGWEWVTVEGTAELAGPEDPLDGLDSDAIRLLLRAVFSAAGGTHDDWGTYDRVMADERRAAVLITPARVYSSR
jgi:PPOX class probable F420-dependent enzyme